MAQGLSALYQGLGPLFSMARHLLRQPTGPGQGAHSQKGTQAPCVSQPLPVEMLRLPGHNQSTELATYAITCRGVLCCHCEATYNALAEPGCLQF